MKLARCVLPALALFALAPTASADRFYFGPEEAAEQMAEGEPDYIEGVLLREEDGLYVIRVEGGEISVPKGQVRKIEKTDLTADAIAQREADAQTYLAEANTLRGQMLAADAAARAERIREARAMEAAARRDAAAVEAAVPVTPVVAPVYDPVLHVTYPVGADDYLIRKELGGVIRRQIQKETKDRLERR